MYAMDGTLVYQEDLKRNKRIYHAYLAGDPVAQVEVDITTGTATNKYLHTDALGSPVAVTNATSGILERTQYEPYGLVINRALRDGPGYTGHVEDAGSGLTYMHQRYYDPNIPRFLSVDPVTPDLVTGSNFNRYWYANNNPFRFTDPDGRRSKEEADHKRDEAQKRRERYEQRQRERNSDPAIRRRPPAGSVTELARNVAGAVVDFTNMTLVGEVSGAYGVGANVSYSDNLKTGGQKVELMGALGVGTGTFVGIEIDMLTMSLPGAKASPILFDSADVKVGDVVAAGFKVQLNPGGTATLKAFGGLGVGGRGLLNKPLSMGTVIWSNEE